MRRALALAPRHARFPCCSRCARPWAWAWPRSAPTRCAPGLTILGVVMGIMTVIGMSSIVAGPERLDGQADRGPRLVGHLRAARRAPARTCPTRSAASARACTLREVEAIAAALPGGARRSRRWSRSSANIIKYGNESVQRRRRSSAPPPAYETVHDIYVDEGPLPLRARRQPRRARWSVIGADIADTLFPYVDPLDKEISIDGRRFRVIGVMEHKGKFLWLNRDNFIARAAGLGARRRTRASTSWWPT